MTQYSRTVVIYRWIVFLLAAFYTLRTLIVSDYSEFGGPFRYLTYWALFGSFFAASRMIALTQARSGRRWDGMVSAVAVLNLMVVYLYWKLYFADPMSVTDNGQLGQWWLEYYLHLGGPLLQWIDVLFIHHAFRRLKASAAFLTLIIGSYVAWIEVFVGPLNSSPVGTVTSGLPYRFLNNLELTGRAQFYVANFVFAMGGLLAFAGIEWLIRRALRRPRAP